MGFGHKGTDNMATHQTDISHIVTNLSEKRATGDSSIPYNAETFGDITAEVGKAVKIHSFGHLLCREFPVHEKMLDLHHRELPDFVVPFKHLSAKIYAAICDAINEFVDDHSAARICRWVKGFLVFGAAIVRRLKLEHPTLVTNYDSNSTWDTLRYFIRVVVNIGEWK